MISRNRSAPTAAAMSIECTTSANSTVTCLYSAVLCGNVIGALHSLQNLAVALTSVPQEPHATPVVVTAWPRPTRYVPRSSGCRLGAVAIPIVSVAGVIAVGTGQERPQP